MKIFPADLSDVALAKSDLADLRRGGEKMPPLLPSCGRRWQTTPSTARLRQAKRESRASLLRKSARSAGNNSLNKR